MEASLAARRIGAAMGDLVEPSGPDAAFHVPADGTALRLRGRDTCDLLHRITTADVRTLPVRAARPAVFCTPKGRIVAAVGIARVADAVWLLCRPGSRAAVAAHLDRYIISEDVTVEDPGDAWGTALVFGSHAAGISAKAGWPEVPAGAVVAAGDGCLVGPFGDGMGATLLAPRATLEEWTTRLAAAGAHAADAGTFERWRVVTGWAAAGRELTEAWNPLEAGLGPAISFTKGCYVGQEVVARLHYYEKRQRRLVRLALAGDPGPCPVPLRAGTTDAGTLTSAAPAVTSGFAGLGYVRTEHATSGTALTAGPVAATVGAPVGGEPLAPPPPAARSKALA